MYSFRPPRRIANSRQMLKIVCFLLFLLPFSLYAQSYADSLRIVRAEHDSLFVKEVLNTEEAAHFGGFCYFEPDTNYRVTATFQRKKGKKFAMPMTKERNRIVYYRAYGTLTFTIRDTVCVLTVYENMDLKHLKAYKNYLFLPFRDGTTNGTTYGGGRFMDIEKRRSDQWIIDFNTAYHPYCAYTERYSCPIPPAENVIEPAIEAGECYHGHPEE